MSVRYKGELPNRRLNDTVELLQIERQFDGFVDKMQFVSVGEFAADVEKMSGGRFAYYQRLGYNHPMTITMRDPEIEFQSIKYNQQELVVKSKTTSPTNSNYIVITADYTSGKV